jgi:hypothetical protein
LTSLKSDASTLARQEADMAQESGLAFSFAVVLTMAVIILAIATWADYLPNPKHDSAAPIAARQAIYQLENW